MQAWGQAGLEARREGKGGGGLQQPLSFVLAPNAGPSATVAIRDLWTQRREEISQGEGRQGGENQSGRHRQTGGSGSTPPPCDHKHRACPEGSWPFLRGQAQEAGAGVGEGEVQQTSVIEFQPSRVIQSSLGLWLQTCCATLISHAPFWPQLSHASKENGMMRTVSFKELLCFVFFLIFT